MAHAEPPVLLTGISPLKPFGNQFFGIIPWDGQEPKVAAVACTKQGHIVLLSLVGFDTSCSAALARLFLGEAGKGEHGIRFEPKPDVVWDGPTRFPRCVSKANKFDKALAGTKERNQVAMVEQANIHLGLLFPPVLPDPKKPEDDESRPLAKYDPTGAAQNTQPVPRYILGNGGEDTPNREAFLGQLRALRVIHATAWADALWLHGLEQGLIAPIPALGVRCWRLEGDLQRWGTFLSQGLKEGWLADPDAERV